MVELLMKQTSSHIEGCPTLQPAQYVVSAENMLPDISQRAGRATWEEWLQDHRTKPLVGMGNQASDCDKSGR